MNSQHKQRLHVRANTLRESKLRGDTKQYTAPETKPHLPHWSFKLKRELSLVADSVMCGVGYHHAGLDVHDRKTVEELFLKGDLPVLSKTTPV